MPAGPSRKLWETFPRMPYSAGSCKEDLFRSQSVQHFSKRKKIFNDRHELKGSISSEGSDRYALPTVGGDGEDESIL